MDPVNRKGESLPLMVAVTTSTIIVDGTSAHAESARLSQGIYRIAVESVASTGIHLAIIDEGGIAATITNSLYMANNTSEYFAIDEGKVLSVIGGKINVVKFI